MTNPKLNRFRNAEFLQYMKYVLQIIEESGLDDMKSEVTELQGLVNEIDHTFQQTQKKPLTQKIIALDIRRDRAIIGVKQVLVGYTNHVSDKKRKASLQLLENIAQYGKDISRLNYQEELVVLDSIVKDWETQNKLVKAVGILGLEDWLQEMKISNAEFSSVYLERVDIISGQTKSQIRTLRKTTRLQFYSIIKHIEAHLILNTSETYVDIEKKMNVLSTEYNLIIAHRS